MSIIEAIRDIFGKKKIENTSVAEATDNCNEISQFVIDKLIEHGCHRPIYIARIDDSLLGLDRKETDSWQIACVFQPELQDYVLNGLKKNNIARFEYSSKDDASVKTKMYDRNIVFYSLPFFLAELGDLSVEACNILFSYSNKLAVLYDGQFGKIYAKRRRLVDVAKYKRFCNKHAINLYDNLFGNRIKQLNLVNLVLEILEKEGNSGRLSQHAERLIAELEDQGYNEYWKEEEIPVGEPSEDTTPVINIFGKKHMFNTRTKTIYARMVRLHNKIMGSIQISNMQDYVVPVANLYNCLSLVKHGEYTYPLDQDTVDFLNLIKNKNSHWYNIRKALRDLSDAIEKGKENIRCDWDTSAAKELLTELYGF